MHKKLKLLTLVFAFQFLVNCCPNYNTNLEFDAKRWKSGDYCARASMSPSLSRSRLLNGKTMDEVQELLGPPDEVFSPNRWSYRSDVVARCSFIWTCYSSIRFDPKSGRTDGALEISD